MLARSNLIPRLASIGTSAKTIPRQSIPVGPFTAVKLGVFFHSSPRQQELSVEHKDIVKSTAPVLAEHGVAITSHFYKRMLDNHPELKNIFNTAHQSTGAQPAALAHAVWAYAVNIDNLGALGKAVSRIGHKHASLGVTPEQYPIVGENLLASIQEVLGDAVSKPVLDAWRAAYQQLADIFIAFEHDLYQKAEQTPGGWKGWRKFKVAHKVHESDEIMSFHLEPLDGAELPTFKSGQYISVRVFVPELGVYQPRQYSLSDTPDGKHFRISIKKEAARENKPAGRISNVLHENLPEGCELDVSMPFGDFTLDVDSDVPIVLISGGVGITPMLSMLGTVTEHAKTRPVVFVHAVRNGRVHAMKDYLSHVLQENPQVSRAIFYEEVADSDRKGVDYDYEGRIELANIKDKVLLQNANYYLCGPVPFMQAQQRSLEALGVPTERIYSEVFGSGFA
ncbi:Nitric oxide oxidoreductase [Neophaeococcomyces mojaviensis]|uniref:Nitric oxide oxidoreductase n=1 Tax=Neophaeococcomyces mojaviensis TaxID=3383035 RepID=A0ACC3A677_9EURO|nr:Nitric oxide oxidoreductase [Knufia sp. JES_112]